MVNEIAEEYNRATLMLNKNQHKKAMVIYKKLLAGYKFKEALVNLGNCYRLENMESRAAECYRAALDDNIPSIDADPLKVVGHALNNLGLSCYSTGDDKRAQFYYGKALKLNPKFWEAWWNNSTSILRQASSGRPELFTRGWEMYDARFLKKPPIVLKNDNPNLVYWDTVSPGRSIVVLVEQGIGDSIMFGRYLHMLPFENVYVQCDPSLEALFSDFKCVQHVSECDAEVAYPICSLAKCFNNGVPIDGDWLSGKFDTRSFPEDKFNVGIVWSGSPTHVNNHNRSVAIGRFNRLSKIANLYGLVPGFKSTKHVQSLDIRSWTDTAECINGLDLVIGVDTSVMHLCGSLGCSGWLLQPKQETDFRWGNGVNKSAWYSSIEVFENPGSWEVTFDNVEKALRERLYEKC